jgi:hypothetical protein
MGWTIPRTFVTGEVETAAIFNAHLRDNLNALNGFVRKTADESVTSSTALQNDNELLYTIPGAGSYIFDVTLFAVSAANAAGDLLIGFSFPAGTCHFGAAGADAGIASGHIQTGEWVGALSATSGVTNIGYGLSTTVLMIRLHGLLIATASGTLQLMWAQAASNANASTVKAGSFLEVKQAA